mmetsp:Transcript_11125/g.41554  ORF Transcript_11125/g.41554 Transcript_11125/m.41554 type:complete len:132 (+) Transcript_11125:944-1339(+)
MHYGGDTPCKVMEEAYELLEEIADSRSFEILENKEAETLIPVSEFNGDGLWSAVHIHPSLPTLIKRVIEYRKRGFKMGRYAMQEFIDEMYFDVKPVWKCFPALRKLKQDAFSDTNLTIADEMEEEDELCSE